MSTDTHVPVNGHASAVATAAVFDTVGVAGRERIIASVPSVVDAVLRNGRRIPASIAEAVLAGAEGNRLTSLLVNRDRVDGVADLVDRIVATGDPDLYASASEPHRTAVLRNAAGSRRSWHGRIRELLRRHTWKSAAQERDDLRHLVHAPFPALLQHVLDVVGTGLSEREIAVALHGLHELSGPEAVRLWAEKVGGEVADRAVAAVAAGEDLSALVAWHESTEATVRELRGDAGDRKWRLAQRPVLGWDVIGSAHAAQPFDADAVGLLVAREDCPDAVIAVFYSGEPAVVAKEAHRVTPGLWRVRPAGTAAVVARAARLLAGRCVSDGVTEPLLTEAMPAVPVLEALRTARKEHPETVAVLHAELTALVEPLGADPDAWLTLRGALKAGRGLSVRAVFAKAAEMRASGRAPKGWPADAAPPADKSPSPTGLRSAFVPLLDAATAGVRLALLPHLDERTRYGLFCHGVWRPEWLDAVIEHRSDGWPELLARRGDLPAEAIRRLLELDDPALNGRLFGKPKTSSRQRAAILSGRRFGPGDDPVPLDPSLKSRLLARKDGGFRGTDVIACADVELQLHMLENVHVRGELPQTMLVVGAWDRHGPEYVERLLRLRAAPYRSHKPIGRALTARFAELLKRDDPSAELAELRERAAYAQTAEWQIAEIRADRTNHFDLAKHAHHWHWPEILAEHAREPLDPWMVGGFAANSVGCPPELRAEALTADDLYRQAESAESAEPFTAEEMRRRLTETAISADRDEARLRLAVAGEVLSAAEALRLAWPAAHAVNVLGEAAGEALAELTAATIGDDPDGMILALRMIGDFHGSIEQLLATAAAAVA